MKYKDFLFRKAKETKAILLSRVNIFFQRVKISWKEMTPSYKRWRMVVKDINISFLRRIIRPLKLHITICKRGHPVIIIQGQAKGQQQGQQ